MSTAPTILCIDDDKLVLEALQRLFQNEEKTFRVLTATNGFKALEILRRESCDVAVIDLGMPQMNGLELLAILQRISPDTESVILTGDNSTEAVVAAMKIGASDYLTKPFDHRRLLTTVWNLAQKKRLKELNLELTRALSEMKNPDRPPIRVLIVDDSPDDRKILSHYLEKAPRPGFEILEVDTIAAAIEAYNTYHPDCVLLDYRLPDGNGIELLRALSASSGVLWTAVIVLTGQGKEEIAVQAMKNGAMDYLVKGELTAANITAIVHQAIERFSDMRKERQRSREKDGLIRELELQRDTLKFEARHDPLTCILNRRAILEQLNKELARAARSKLPLSVGLCDLDHFKRINDTYGHPTGDEVLVEFVMRSLRIFRGYDSVGRYGGEEFLIICTENDVQQPFERLRAIVANTPFQTQAGPVEVTVSIGVVVLTREADEFTSLELADVSLYRAKEKGRNRVEFYYL